jgi:hypothetical protein
LNPLNLSALSISVRLLSLIFAGGIFLSSGAAMKTERPSKQSSDYVVDVGNIFNQKIDELSGLACSRLNDGVLWAINDGGNQPILFAVGNDGADLGSVLITGAQNRDWEDVASFVLGTKTYLLVADVGDNFSHYESSTIYIVEEPAITGFRLKKNSTVKVAARILFTFEDGPRDCEAVAVDSAGKKIFLLTKRTSPAVLYELPLDLDKKESTGIARRKYPISTINKPSAMDISPQSNSAVVLTYHRAYLFKRQVGENWSTAFSRAPRVIKFPALLQQEAICFSNDGKSVYISSEGRPAPLLRIDLQDFTSSQ